MLRVTSYTDFDPLSSFRVLGDERVRKVYDKNIDKYEIQKKLGANLFYLYQSTNRIGMVSSRDVFYYSFQNVERDGSVTCVFWEDLNAQETKGKVRMRMPIAAFKFKPIRDDLRGKTEVQLLCEASLGGSIPTWVQG